MREVDRVERIIEGFENHKPFAEATGTPEYDVYGEGKAQCGLGDDTEAGAAVAAKKNWPVLQPEALHGLAGEIVRLIDPHTEADPAALLVQFLVGFGNLIGRTAYFVADGAIHYLNLFCVLVGETSKGRKGTSWSHTLKLLRAQDEGWAKESVQGGLSSGEGLIWAVRDPIYKTEAVKPKGVVCQYEEVMVDAGVSDKRLQVVESEFAATLKVMSRPGNTLSETIRQGWDHGHLRILNKTSPAKATGAHISIIAHSTMADLKRYLESTDAANGFGNRFLWCCVRRSKCLPEGGRIEGVDFAPVLRSLAAAVKFARGVGKMRLDDKALELWKAVYPGLSEGKPGLTGSITARGEAQTMRLACLYALLDSSLEVRKEHLQAALAVWEYCEDSAKCIFGTATGDLIADKILVVLRNTPGGMTKSEITRGLFQRNKEAKQIDEALSLLLKQRKITKQPEATAGRESERFFAVGVRH